MSKLSTLTALVLSALTLGNAFAAHKSWDQPDFDDAKPAIEKSRAEVRAETLSFLMKEGKNVAVGQYTIFTAPKQADNAKQSRAISLAGFQHGNAERS
jgi:hypothetical protein